MEAFLKDFDFAALLPEMETFLGQLRFWLGLFLVAGPLIMLSFGLVYFFRPTDSPRSTRGYRSYFTSASTQSWKFAQRIAGMTWTVLGGGLFVVGLILSLFFGAMDALAMATTALVYLCLELAAVVAAQVFINLRVLKYFDKDGNPL